MGRPASSGPAHPENPLGGLVVEDHCPRGVDDEHRHEEITRQLAHEDHLHGLLGHQCRLRLYRNFKPLFFLA
jgi:hypothetical protein